VVEHYLDTIKRPVLAIFSRFLFFFETIEEQLISLMIVNVLMLSHVISQNPKNFFRVTSRVQVFEISSSEKCECFSGGQAMASQIRMP
jgi:hypothetical protein